jgi:hypothetical protein
MLTTDVVRRGEPGFPLDDAWIHAVFARNLATGHGFSFNPGEPVGGSTAPLWSIALAGAYLATGDMIVGAMLLGAACYVLGVLVAVALARRLGAGGRTAALAGTLVALVPWQVWGILSGMEIPLYVLLSLLGLHLALAPRPPLARRALLGTIVLSLATLSRPECATLLVATWLGMATGHLRAPTTARPVRVRRLAAVCLHAAIAVAVLLPWALFNHATAGSWLPTTYAVKAGHTGLAAAASGLDVTRLVGALVGEPVRHLGLLAGRLLEVDPVLLPFAVLGCVHLWRSRRGGGGAGRTLVVAWLLYPLAMSLVEPHSRLASRYVVTPMVLFVLIGVIGVAAMLRSVRQASATWHRFLVRGLVAACLLIQLAGCIVAAGRWSQGIGNINRLHRRAARWIDRELPAECVIALDDIGAIRYHARQRVIDMIGLASPEVIPLRARGLTPAQIVCAMAADAVATVRPWQFRDRAVFPCVRVFRVDDNIASVSDSLLVLEVECTSTRPAGGRPADQGGASGGAWSTAPAGPGAGGTWMDRLAVRRLWYHREVPRSPRDR